ncbi:hypothetical protein BU16DRAFT_334236 [Lophium mytilinum]|uniref:Uncharacterized protein n=1 Tax=Lophium mytilinum TaxID=390894 RepID=A0A6A6R033_9PEZI|nr:hypothetical protein BU16DRAFT_334236 [Lophium mytilinum]
MDPADTINTPGAFTNARNDLAYAIANCPLICPKGLLDAKNELIHQFYQEPSLATMFSKRSLLDAVNFLHDMRNNEILAPDIAWELILAETWEIFGQIVQLLPVEDGTAASYHAWTRRRAALYDDLVQHLLVRSVAEGRRRSKNERAGKWPSDW